jgi:hypothetical protein
MRRCRGSPEGEAPVAQLDRAPDYESGGREFESLRARHFGIRYRRYTTIHPLGPRRRGSNSAVRIAARLGRPINTTPSPSSTTVVAGGAVNTSPSRRLIWTMKNAPLACLSMASTVIRTALLCGAAVTVSSSIPKLCSTRWKPCERSRPSIKRAEREKLPDDGVQVPDSTPGAIRRFGGLCFRAGDLVIAPVFQRPGVAFVGRSVAGAARRDDVQTVAARVWSYLLGTSRPCRIPSPALWT